MKKRTVAMLVTLGVLAALAGAYVYLRVRPAPEPSAFEEDAKKELSKLDAEKLQKIVLSDRPEGTLTLVKKDGAWALEPASPVKLDTTTVDDLVYSFTALFAERTIDEHPSDLGQYGLVPPRAVARAWLADGTVKTLLLGDETPAGNTYYLQVQGDPAVYSVWMNHGQHFHWRVVDLRSKALLTAITKDEIVYFKARLRSGQTLEAVQKTPDELKQFQLGFGSYLLVKPFPVPRGVDAEKFDALLTGAASLDIAEFVDDSPTDLAAYGLARPWGELLVRDKAGTLHLLFGADRGQDRVCFQVAGERAVYAVDKYKLDFMNTRPFDVMDKFVFIPNIDDVDELHVTARGATRVFSLSRVTKKAAEAGAEDEVVTTYRSDGRDLAERYAAGRTPDEAKEAAESAFKKFYQSAIALSIEGEAPRPVPNAPVITIRYRLNKGDKRDVTVTLAPYDKIFYAPFVDGVGGFALTKAQAESMLAKMDALLKGEDLKD